MSVSTVPYGCATPLIFWPHSAQLLYPLRLWKFRSEYDQRPRGSLHPVAFCNRCRCCAGRLYQGPPERYRYNELGIAGAPPCLAAVTLPRFGRGEETTHGGRSGTQLAVHTRRLYRLRARLHGFLPLRVLLSQAPIEPSLKEPPPIQPKSVPIDSRAGTAGGAHAAD